MTCRQTRQRLHEALDARAERWPAQVEHHLGSCPECRLAAEQLRALVGAAAQHETPQPTDRYLASAAKRAVLARRTRSAAPRHSFAWAGMAAGVFALCLLSFTIGRVYFPATEARTIGAPPVDVSPNASVLPAVAMGQPAPLPVWTAASEESADDIIEDLPALEPVLVTAPAEQGFAPPSRRVPRAAVAARMTPTAPRALQPDSPAMDAPREVGIEINGTHHRITIRRIDAGTELGPIDPSILRDLLPEPAPSEPIHPLYDYRTDNGLTRGV